jgi:hypothetical protein
MRPVAVLVALAAMASVASADPLYDPGPDSQPLACPGGAAECQLDLVGRIDSVRSSSRWAAVRLDVGGRGRSRFLYAAIKPSQLRQLALQSGARYRLRVTAKRPFGGLDLWVIDANRL